MSDRLAKISNRLVFERTDLNLAFICQPFDDELFGSWLARLMRENSFDLASTFWGSIGASGPTHRLSSDPVESSRALDSFCGLFHLSTDRLLQALTTKPFWTCFSATPSKGPNPRSKLLRVCPCCLVEDESQYGVAYFHRQHQLPATSCCVEHAVVLYEACVDCLRPICHISTIGTPPRTCHCGADLHSVLPIVSAPSTWLEVSNFSFECLSAAPDALPAARTFQAALARLNDLQGRQTSRGLSLVFDSHFGSEGELWLANPSSIIGRPNFVKTQFRKPARLVVLLCALDLSFAAAQALARSEGDKGQPAKPLIGKTLTEANALESAKGLAATFLATREIPSNRRSYYFRQCQTKAYWLLRLKDPDWLRALFSSVSIRGGFPPIPTVAKDRVLINSSKRWEAKDARARMAVRDRDWLDSRPRALHWRKREAEAISGDLLTQVRDAREKNDSAEGRPRRFTIKLAASQLGLSHGGLFLLSKRSPEVAALVPESKDDYLMRAMRWALYECIRLNIRLTAVNMYKQNKSYAYKICKPAAEKLVDQYLRTGTL